MKLQLTAQSWLTLGAIASVCGGSAIISSAATAYLITHSHLTHSPYDRWLLPTLLLALVLGSLAVAVWLLHTFILKYKLDEEKFRHIFAGAAIGIGLDSLDGTIVESNPALQTMLGYTREELAQMRFAEFTHPDDLAVDTELFSEMIAGNRDSYQIDKRHIRKDGELRWVRLTNSLVRYSNGDPKYTIAVAEDITQLKQAQESVTLYGDIVQRMQLGILVWQLQDLDDLTSFRLIECNPAACDILQVTVERQAFIGQNMATIFPDLLDTAFPKLYAEVIRSGQVRDLGEMWFGDRPNPARICTSKAFPLPNQCVGLIFEDITERKQAETALQQSEARFRVVAETASCAFLIYQGNHLRYVNPATEQITGYSYEELLQMPFWELAHPDYRDLVRQRGLARQRGESVPRRYEIKIVTKNGEERWVDVTGGAAYLNGQAAALATAYDITERKQAEAQLQLAANRDRLMAEIALRIRSSLNLEEILQTTVAEVRQFLKADRVFVAYLDPEGGCRTIAESVDPQWKSMLGWEVDGRSATIIRELFTSDAVLAVNDIREIAQTPLLQEHYQRCQVKAGMGVPILLNGDLFGVLIVNQCSAPRRWQPFEVELLKRLGTQVEIAIQQGQLYQQLRAMATNLECQVEERTLELQQRMQELQNLNQVKDVLLHAVTHDLRTPVQGMLMVLNHLRDKGDEMISMPRSMLDRMIESSDRQLTLLNSLMENHTDTKPPLPCSYQPVYLHHLVENALAVLAGKLTKNRSTVINQISAALPPVTVDPTKLQQVFEQLLLNAMQHNPPGRTVILNAIEIKSAQDTNHRCNRRNTPFLYCTVEDDGEGLQPDQCDRLFQLYVRGLDNRHLTGIGLGLHRCQQIISAHGGKIGVHSQPGRGSQFWFTLPLSRLPLDRP